MEEELATEDALGRLVDFGLIEEVEEQAQRLHQLLAEFVRQQEEIRLPEAQEGVGQGLLERAQEPNAAGYPLQLLPLQPHLRAITNAVLSSESELAASLSNALGLHLLALGAYSDAQFYLQQALAIRREALGAEHPDVATSLNNLAALYYSQGKYEQAEPLLQRAIAIYKKTFGSHHPSTKTIQENYARFLEEKKRRRR